MENKVVEELKKGYEKHCASQEGNCLDCEYRDNLINCIWKYIEKNLKGAIIMTKDELKNLKKVKDINV